jgi:hypothetical protein
MSLPALRFTPPHRSFAFDLKRLLPLGVWGLALLIAFGGGFVAANPRYGGAALGVAGLVGIACALIRRPALGLYLMAAILPFFPLFRYTGQYFNIGLPYGILGLWPELALCIMLLCVLVRRMKGGQALGLRSDTLPFVVMAAGCLYALCLTLSLKAIPSALYGMHTSFLGYGIFFVTYWLQPSPKETRRFLFIWLVSFTLFALCSLADYALRPAFLIKLAILARPNFWGGWEPHMFFRWYPRMQSLLFAEQVWGTACALVSIYGLSWFSEKKRPRGIFVACALATLCVGLSMSRGALICWAVGVCALCVSRGRHRWAVMVMMALMACATGALIVYFGGQDAVETLVRRTMALFDTKDKLAYDRVDQWKYAVDLFPLVPAGRGLGRGGPAALLHGINDGFMAIVDGGYFTILTEQGLPGLMTFVLGGFAALIALSRRARYLRLMGDREGLVLCRAVAAFLGGALVHTLASTPLESYYVGPMFWILAGIAMARQPVAPPTPPKVPALLPPSGPTDTHKRNETLPPASLYS